MIELRALPAKFFAGLSPRSFGRRDLRDARMVATSDVRMRGARFRRRGIRQLLSPHALNPRPASTVEHWTS